MEQVFYPLMGVGVLHAFILAVVCLTKKTSQLFDYGDISLELARLIDIDHGVARPVKVKQFLSGQAISTSDIIILQLVRVQVLFIPIMRFTSVAPMFLYFISGFILLALKSGVNLENWDAEPVGYACLVFAFSFQIMHIFLKIFSGMAGHLMELHPLYKEKSVIAIVTDWTSFKK